MRPKFLYSDEKPYSKQTIIERFYNNVLIVPFYECWEWFGWTRKNYGRFQKGSRVYAAHRFSYELHIGPISEGLSVCHKCDNPKCVNPSHLFLGTNHDNVMDRVAKGRTASQKGEKNPASKLTAEAVRFIRSSNLPSRKLGLMFGVDKSIILDAKNRQTWKHID